MEPAKVFNNVIVGQFVLTGVPVKVYVDGRYLSITDADDVSDPEMGFGMDENGSMKHFDYRLIEKLLVSGNEVTIDVYNKGMEAKFTGGDGEAKEEKPKEDEDDKQSDKLPKESVSMKLKNLMKEASQEEVDADIEGAEAQIDAAKAKTKAAKAAEKNIIKKAKEKIKAAQAQPIEDGVMRESHYTFGVGDIVKNKNTSCPHHGSMGVVKKLMNLDNDMGTVAVYRVTNQGSTYRPGDVLTKTIDQLEPIQSPDDLEGEQ
jgi:hypothetical protein